MLLKAFEIKFSKLEKDLIAERSSLNSKETELVNIKASYDDLKEQFISKYFLRIYFAQIFEKFKIKLEIILDVNGKYKETVARYHRFKETTKNEMQEQKLKELVRPLAFKSSILFFILGLNFHFNYFIN